MKTLRFASLLLVYVLTGSCGSSGGNGQGEPSDSSSVKTTDTSGLSDMKLYALPAPLEVSTALRSYDNAYTTKVFERTKDKTADYLPNYLKGLNLGVYCVDMGYATVYDDHNMALKYLDKVEKVMNELNLSTQAAAFVKKYKDNINNKDSLYKFILMSYNEANRYFRDNKREDVGLMILTGGFIEGLYISSNIVKKDDQEGLALIAQQQLYLDNIIELIRTYNQDKDIADLLIRLQDLKSAYYGIEIDYDSVNSKVRTKTEITEKQLNLLRLKVSSVRNYIIS
ncbi:MAG: hypothetical protein AB1458_06515 [Bacteroidota bacterium]